MSKKAMVKAGILKAETRELFRFLQRIQGLDDETLLPAPEVELFSEQMTAFFPGGNNESCTFSAPICGLEEFAGSKPIGPAKKR